MSEDEDPVGPPWFEDVTARLGIDFVHDPGPVEERDGAGKMVERYFMPAIVGSGVALFDFDGDGLLDLYLLQGAGPDGPRAKLYKQMPGGTFKDVSAGSGLDIAGHCQGVAVGDVNNDGLPDVAVSLFGGIKLFLNQGDGTFKEAALEAGLRDGLWGTSLAFIDYDRDGRLDLFVTNYIAYDPSWHCKNNDGKRDFCAPKSFKGTASKLFRNLGTQAGKKAGKAALPTFKDVSFESGVSLKAGPGLGVICADFTGDGWPDIFVANDGAANHLWVNQRDGTFKEEAAARGVAVNAMGAAEGNMGIGWGDIDGDGLPDVFVTHLDNETNTVWKQGPVGMFKDWTVGSRMHRPRWRGTGFGTVLADFDNDGHLDAAILNGAVTRSKPDPSSLLGPFWSRYGQRNQLFRNDGTGRFEDISTATPGFCGTANVGRVLAVGDLDNSGSSWLVATQIGGPAKVLRNVVPDRGYWLRVRCLLPLENGKTRDALGAEARVEAGGRRQVRTIQTNGGYLASNDPRAHFGLGKVATVVSVEVRWPDGKRERFAGRPANQELALVQGQGSVVR